MDYILGVIALTAFICIFNFFAFWILSLRNRSSVKKALKQAGYEKYDEIFAKNILHQSISESKKEVLFYKQQEWPDIESTKIKKQLRNQRRLNSISIGSFIGFIVCYVLVMILSTIFNR